MCGWAGLSMVQPPKKSSMVKTISRTSWKSSAAQTTLTLQLGFIENGITKMHWLIISFPYVPYENGRAFLVKPSFSDRPEYHIVSYMSMFHHTSMINP
jgi:hypothetical protein